MKFCLAVAILLISFSIQAKTAYMGIVGAGRGNGILGHSFLLIKDTAQPYLVGDVYQYNIAGKNGLPPSPADLATNNFNFSLSQNKFMQIFSSYTDGENRIIALYELNLNASEVDELLVLLKKDKADVHFGENHEYGPYNNCVTRPLELINSIVGNDRKIEYFGKDDVAARDAIGILDSLQGAILNRLPFYIANTLENHPISKGRSQLYENRTTRMARYFNSIHSDVQQMASSCSWKSSTQTTVELYLLLFLTEPQRYSIDPVVKLTDSCAASLPLFKNTLLKLYQVMETKNEEAKQKLYDLIGKMGAF
jgi:hypothetical protein